MLANFFTDSPLQKPPRRSGEESAKVGIGVLSDQPSVFCTEMKRGAGD